MTVIAHLSDPHFGSEDPAIAAALLAELTTTVPALVVISGDLTQRARERELGAARGFLDQIAAPLLVVPGNHDVPLYDLGARLFHPLERYQRLISAELQPTFVDDQLAVVGLTTAHGRTIKGGRINRAQLARACAWLSGQGDRCRIVVAHHPLMVPRGFGDDDLAGGAEAALPALEAAGAELILTGHLHRSFAADAAAFRSDDRAVVAVHAGTCMSTRLRGEPNGYNRLILAGERLTVEHRVWDGARFVVGTRRGYQRSGGRWRYAA